MKENIQNNVKPVIFGFSVIKIKVYDLKSYLFLCTRYDGHFVEHRVSLRTIENKNIFILRSKFLYIIALHVVLHNSKPRSI